jgi:hypothetical protein
MSNRAKRLMIAVPLLPVAPVIKIMRRLPQDQSRKHRCALILSISYWIDNRNHIFKPGEPASTGCTVMAIRRHRSSLNSADETDSYPFPMNRLLHLAAALRLERQCICRSRNILDSDAARLEFAVAQCGSARSRRTPST